MNRDRSYEDYYVRQVGDGLPVFTGGRVQRGHGLGSLFGGLIRSAVPLIKNGAMALGKRAFKTGLNVAGDVVAGHNLKDSAKRRVKEAGKDMISRILRGETPSGIRYTPKRPIKRKPLVTPAIPSKQRRRRKTRSDDIFST